MVCLWCPLMSVIGGAVGSWIGVNPPPTKKGEIISATFTISLTLITTIALKIIFNIPLCYPGGWFTAKNLLLVPLKTIFLGTIYMIGVNYLLNKYVYFNEVEKQSGQKFSEDKQEKENCSHCKKHD